MKTCILLTDEFPYGKWETFLEYEVSYLSKKFDVIYIIPFCNAKDIKRSLPDNFRLINIPTKKKFFYLLTLNKWKDKKNKRPIGYRILCNYCFGKGHYYSNKIIKLISNNSININRDDDIIIYSYWMNLLPITSIDLKKRLIKLGYKNVNAISRCHRVDIYNEENKYNRIPFQPIFIKELDYIFPCSDDGTHYLQSIYSKHADKIITARLGTQDNILPKRDIGKTVFVTCSRLSNVKRLDMFAKAFSLICKKNRNVCWVCIGIGEQYGEIIEILKNNNAINNFLPLVYKSKDEIYELYRTLKLGYFVNVSSSEGVPVSIMEAMSFGFPIIATNVGGTCEIVGNDNGFLVEKNISVNDLKKTLEEAISISDSSYNSLSSNSYTKWQNLCSASKNFSEWAKKLEDICLKFYEK